MSYILTCNQTCRCIRFVWFLWNMSPDLAIEPEGQSAVTPFEWKKRFERVTALRRYVPGFPVLGNLRGSREGWIGCRCCCCLVEMQKKTARKTEKSYNDGHVVMPHRSRCTARWGCTSSFEVWVLTEDVQTFFPYSSCSCNSVFFSINSCFPDCFGCVGHVLKPKSLGYFEWDLSRGKQHHQEKIKDSMIKYQRQGMNEIWYLVLCGFPISCTLSFRDSAHVTM